MEGKASPVEAGEKKISPTVIKNPKGKPVNSGQKLIIINLYNDIKAKEPQIKYAEMIMRLANQTGVGCCTIKTTISEYKKTGTISSPNKKKIRPSTFEKLTDNQKAQIRAKVQQFMIDREVPNIKKILAVVNDDDTLPNFSKTTLWRTLRELKKETKKLKLKKGQKYKKEG